HPVLGRRVVDVRAAALGRVYVGDEVLEVQVGPVVAAGIGAPHDQDTVVVKVVGHVEVAQRAGQEEHTLGLRGLAHLTQALRDQEQNCYGDQALHLVHGLGDTGNTGEWEF
ncbi:hypothetical protein EGW08_023555, partial [Elysia chlorotica]